MKENNYPVYDGESGVMAAEPVARLAYAPQRVERIHRIPNGVPRTAEEAVADIEASEWEFERGETYSHTEVMQAVWNRIMDYAD